MKHVRIYLQVAIVTVLGAAIALASDAGAEQTLAITHGSKVTLEYTLALPDRTVVESNVGREPISYTQGNSEVLPGLEKALAGLKAGDKKHVTLSADEAYGPYDEKKKVTVTKEQVPPEAKVGTSTLARRMEWKRRSWLLTATPSSSIRITRWPANPSSSTSTS